MTGMILAMMSLVTLSKKSAATKFTAKTIFVSPQ
jgi:hypothetical protein